MVQTAINLFTVRNYDASTIDVLERVAEAGYDGVQFSGGFGDADVGDVANALDDLGLGTTGVHVDFDDLERDPDRIVDTYRQIDVDAAVVSWLDAEYFESRDAAVSTANRLEELRETLAGREFELHYHNHDHEFVDVGEESAFGAFADACSVGLELDVGWVQTGGYDPVSLLRRYADRVDLVHMKDMADGEFREIGDGDVDMQACADAARAADASWLVYEHDEATDPEASIRHGASFLSDL